MSGADDNDLQKAVALRDVTSILTARQRALHEVEHARDALERKSEELARSLAMMKATLDSAIDGILVTNARFETTAFNASFLRMWQLKDGDVWTRGSKALLDNLAARFARPGELRARLEAIYADSQPSTFDLLHPLDDRTIELHTRLQVAEGEHRGRVWTFRDSTDQRRAEEALRDESRVLELLNRTGRNLTSKLDLHAVVQAVTDAGTQISKAAFGAFFYTVRNPQGEEMLLYTLSGAPREAFEKFGHPRPTALFGPTFRGEAAIRIGDVLNDPRYGRSSPHHGMPQGHLPVRSYLAVPVVSRSGEVIGGLFFGHPQAHVFTERSERIMVGIAAQAAVAIDNARLYEAAQQAASERQALLERERSARALAERMSALKDDFLATLSHELRTPLSAILGWVHILRRGIRSPEDLQKALDTIERNARLQTQLIEDLLEMNRIASGKVRLYVQPLSPISFIEPALETIHPAAEAKGVRIERLLDPSAGPVSGDPGRLQQVMGNLLSNAVKFTGRGGTVQVLLERVNSHVEITVADTGVGIRPEFVAHVFERFRQADSSTTRKYGGLGLGLSIVHNLVELHGGTVHAASAGEGLGASFCVRLPVSAVRSAIPAQPRLHPRDAIQLAPAFAALDLSGMTLLVVDDDDDARELVRRILCECEARVLVAANAAEALQLVEQHRPDVAHHDVGMPEVDGYELLRRIRALGPERGGRVPAIALTAFARSQDRTQALHAGFVAHLSKPVEPPELLATVASAAGRTG